MTSLSMDTTMETFYVSILKYAGLTQSENGDIVNIDPKFGDFKIDGKHIRLPYQEYLKDPEGRQFLHLLNEPYTLPDTAMFSLFKRRMICELNIRLTELVMKLIQVASEPRLQQRLRSNDAVNLITSLGEVGMETVDAVVSLMKASRKVNDEGFLFDIFLKKNGEIDDTPYAAIGKVNFHAYKEMQNAYDTKDSSGYKVFGKKISKRDLDALLLIFEALFPTIDRPETFYVGTNFKGFRYLNVLLKTSYQISDRINQVVELLKEAKEPALSLETVECDMQWTTVLEKLYGMLDTIRMTPNQNNPKLDAAHRLNTKEPEGTPAPTHAPRVDYQPPQPPPVSVARPEYQPQQPPPQPAPHPNYPQPTQPAPTTDPNQPLSVEDIVRRGMQQVPAQPVYGSPYPAQYPPTHYQQPAPQPQYPYPQPAPQPQYPPHYPPQQGYPQPQPAAGYPYPPQGPGYPPPQWGQPGYGQPAPQQRPPLDPYLCGPQR